MTSSDNSLDVARDNSQDAVRAGFEALAAFLDAAPVGATFLASTETALSPSSIADDPARVGLDELERTIRATRRHL
jgi:hypothetical protein